MAKISPIAITAYQCVSAAGNSLDALHQALLRNQTCLGELSLFELPFSVPVGQVKTPLPKLRDDLKAYDCRNARLALLALAQGDLRQRIESSKRRYGAQRIGVVLGTSTSGIYDTENGYQHLQQTGTMPTDFQFLKTHTAQATAEFLQQELALSGPCLAISTACSSSAKALATAQRWIDADICEAVLVAGVDSLCRLTLRGFGSLQLLSSEACRPMDAQRSGINIGEAAALILLERDHAELADQPHLLAIGESSDAYHMSAPHPEGQGAAQAMRQALALANVELRQIDYLNLHATSSQLNDQAEANAVNSLFSKPPLTSGVKGLIGHTLGAAGAVETVICLLALERQFLPGTCGLQQVDPACALPMLIEPKLNHASRYMLSNAFGFGGNNASVLLEAGA